MKRLDELPDFRVTAKAGYKRSAIKYYRAEVPMRTLEKLGLAIAIVDDGEDDREAAMEYTIGSDIVTMWQPKDEGWEHYVSLFKDLKPMKENGKVIYPPLVVIDSDDAVDLVTPLNASYASFGIRDWDGRFLEPGETVYWTNKDGSKVPLWEDKKTFGMRGTIFDIERNIKMCNHHYDISRRAAGVTTTCQYLADIYKEQGIEEVYVFPNSVIPEDYRMPSVNRLDPDKIRIIWEGGASHVDSWFTIKDPFVEFIKNHPEVTCVIFGQIYPWMEREIPAEQLELHPWEQYGLYKIKRMLVGADINLCPLLDQPFSRSKSAIRWYEASMVPEPEASLAANVGPYQEIQDGETGLLYNNGQEFLEKLEILVKDAELRKRLGHGARKWILENRTAEKTVPGLFEFYKHLKEKQRHAHEASR